MEIQFDKNQVQNPATLKTSAPVSIEKFKRTFFTNPIAYHAVTLIINKVARNINELYKLFPIEEGLDRFLDRIVAELCDAGAISMSTAGTFEVINNEWKFCFDSIEASQLYPVYISAIMERILKDRNFNGKHDPNLSIARIVTLPDTPTIRARVRRLHEVIRGEIAEMVAEGKNQNTTATGTRSLIFLTTNPKGEDFL